jgi:hypothetical protein
MRTRFLAANKSRVRRVDFAALSTWFLSNFENRNHLPQFAATGRRKVKISTLRRSITQSFSIT